MSAVTHLEEPVPRLVTIIISTAALLAVSGCGSTPSENPAPTTTTRPAPTEPAPVEQEPVEPAPEPGTVPEEQAEQQWPMPNLVGSVLQDAQDQIQQLTGGAILYTGSHDLTGEKRNQVLDANWQVCTQDVAAGAPLTSASRIDFGVVKIDESCP
jgi:hypothetical protein